MGRATGVHGGVEDTGGGTLAVGASGGRLSGVGPSRHGFPALLTRVWSPSILARVPEAGQASLHRFSGEGLKRMETMGLVPGLMGEVAGLAEAPNGPAGWSFRARL